MGVLQRRTSTYQRAPVRPGRVSAPRPVPHGVQAPPYVAAGGVPSSRALRPLTDPSARGSLSVSVIQSRAQFASPSSDQPRLSVAPYRASNTSASCIAT